jgi:prephenate dehydratase
VIESGALISAAAADVGEPNTPVADVIPAQAAIKCIADKTESRTRVEAIARTAKGLNDLREAWLIPLPNHPCTLLASLGVWAAEGVEAKSGPSADWFLTISPPNI